MQDRMTTVVGVGMILSVVIGINEIRFLGRTGLAWVLIGVAVVLLLYGIALLHLLNRDN